MLDLRIFLRLRLEAEHGISVAEERVLAVDSEMDFQVFAQPELLSQAFVSKEVVLVVGHVGSFHCFQCFVGSDQRHWCPEAVEVVLSLSSLPLRQLWPCSARGSF